MKTSALEIYALFESEEFDSIWLKDIWFMKNMNCAIYDDGGVVLNGKWISGEFKRQKLGVKTINHQIYAIYDTRCYGEKTIAKAYSELMHEVFHCCQILHNINILNRPMVEGAALLVEMIFYQKYEGVSVEEQLECYKNNMNATYYDYYCGAVQLYNMFSKGYTWIDYFKENRK